MLTRSQPSRQWISALTAAVTRHTRRRVTSTVPPSTSARVRTRAHIRNLLQRKGSAAVSRKDAGPRNANATSTLVVRRNGGGRRTNKEVVVLKKVKKLPKRRSTTTTSRGKASFGNDAAAIPKLRQSKRVAVSKKKAAKREKEKEETTDKPTLPVQNRRRSRARKGVVIAARARGVRTLKAKSATSSRREHEPKQGLERGDGRLAAWFKQSTTLHQRKAISSAAQVYAASNTFSVRLPAWRGVVVVHVGEWFLQHSKSKRHLALSGDHRQRNHRMSAQVVAEYVRSASSALPVRERSPSDWRQVRGVLDTRGREWLLDVGEWSAYRSMKLGDEYAKKQQLSKQQYNPSSYVKQGKAQKKRKDEDAAATDKNKKNKHFVSRHKAWQNSAIQTAMLKTFPDIEAEATGHVLLLDDAMAGTSLTMGEHVGVPAHRVHVPNPGTQVQSRYCQHHSKSLYEFVRDLPYDPAQTPRFCAAIFDLCCTLGGSEGGTRPRADIELFFSRRLLNEDGGLFSCTFSRRGKHAATLEETYEFVTSTARRHGYNLTLVNGGDKGQKYNSGSNMLFFLFRSSPAAAGSAKEAQKKQPVVEFSKIVLI